MIILSGRRDHVRGRGYRHFDTASVSWRASRRTGWPSRPPGARHAVGHHAAWHRLLRVRRAGPASGSARAYGCCLSGPEQLTTSSASSPRAMRATRRSWARLGRDSHRAGRRMAIAAMAHRGLGRPGDRRGVEAGSGGGAAAGDRSMLPVGLVGFMLAALLPGFLATFSSTVNGGAAGLVKRRLPTLHQSPRGRPHARARQLRRLRAPHRHRPRHSRLRHLHQRRVPLDLRHAGRRHPAAERAALGTGGGRTVGLRGGRAERDGVVAGTGGARHDRPLDAAAALHRLPGDRDRLDASDDHRRDADATDRAERAAATSIATCSLPARGDRSWLHVRSLDRAALSRRARSAATRSTRPPRSVAICARTSARCISCCTATASRSQLLRRDACARGHPERDLVSASAAAEPLSEDALPDGSGREHLVPGMIGMDRHRHVA